LLAQFDQCCALAVAAKDRRGDGAGEGIARDVKAVGAGFVEADHPGDTVGEHREAAGHQTAIGAVAAHRGDQDLGPWHQGDATCQHLVDHLDRQTFQQPDAFAQRRLEGDFAAHRAFGDRRDFRLDPGEIRQLVDAFLLDHGGIHVGEKQQFAPAEARLHHDVEARQCRAEAAGYFALILIRAKGNVGGGAVSEPLRRKRVGQ